jgi:GTP-sensing pleiotropic transcriptional regulator CodY
MIEITTGTIEEQIIKILQKTYPVTITDVEDKLQLPRKIIMRVLKKFQTKGIIRLEPLPDKTYIRLLRHDFSFVGKRRQKKFIKHRSQRKKQQPEEYDGIMYS